LSYVTVVIPRFLFSQANGAYAFAGNFHKNLGGGSQIYRPSYPVSFPAPVSDLDPLKYWHGYMAAW